MVGDFPLHIFSLLPPLPEHEHFFVDDLVVMPRVGILQRDTKIMCLLCDKSYILGNMRAHVGQHILRHICGESNEKTLEVYFSSLCTLSMIDMHTAWCRTMWFLRKRRLHHQACEYREKRCQNHLQLSIRVHFLQLWEGCNHNENIPVHKCTIVLPLLSFAGP